MILMRNDFYENMDDDDEQFANFGYPKRKKIPAELHEIADKKLSNRKPITQEEIYDFLIDLFLAEKKMKEKPNKLKNQKGKSRKYVTSSRKPKKVKKQYRKEGCILR